MELRVASWAGDRYGREELVNDNLWSDYCPFLSGHTWQPWLLSRSVNQFNQSDASKGSLILFSSSHFQKPCSCYSKGDDRIVMLCLCDQKTGNDATISKCFLVQVDRVAIAIKWRNRESKKKRKKRIEDKMRQTVLEQSDSILSIGFGFLKSFLSFSFVFFLFKLLLSRIKSSHAWAVKVHRRREKGWDNSSSWTEWKVSSLWYIMTIAINTWIWLVILALATLWTEARREPLEDVSKKQLEELIQSEDYLAVVWRKFWALKWETTTSWVGHWQTGMTIE